MNLLKNNWDEAILFISLGGLFVVSQSYPNQAGDFPAFFLLVGCIFIGVELLVKNVPEPYHSGIREMTTGLAADMKPDSSEHISSDNTSETGTVSDVRLGFELVLLVSVSWLFAYLVGFLFIVPLLTFGTTLVFREDNWTTISIVTVVLLIAVYFLFGMLLGVPTLEGELIT